MPQPPRTVVFDIGNVLLRWDPRNLYNTLIEDPAQVEWFLDTVCTSAWNLEFDRGRSFAEGVTELVARHPEWASHIRAFDERWQETLAGPIEANVAVLERLTRAGVPVYAITNFSHEKFSETQARFPFLRLFEGVVVSGDVRLVKPDPAIFHLFLERYGLAAEDCAFIDDSAANIETARAVGMQAIHYGPAVDVAAELAKLGIVAAQA